MPLDMYVIRAGFGETIVLKWTDRNQKRAALVDCFAPQRGRGLESFLRDKLGINSLAFVVATHPHFDHVCNMAQVMYAFRGSIERFWWWGGLAEGQYIAFFNRLARFLHSRNKDLRPRAKSVKELFSERREQFRDHGRPESDDVLCIAGEVVERPRIYPAGAQEDTSLKVTAFSPWDGRVTRFTGIVSEGLRKPGSQLEDTHSEENNACVGLILQYGKAQVILGADVEAPNWEALRSSRDCPSFDPCVVKVSHHGSRNGRIDGMWSGERFLIDETRPPIAIITPWHRELPDKNVIKEIREAGCHVYVTVQGFLKPWPQYIHVSIEDSGVAKVEKRTPDVRYYPPC